MSAGREGSPAGGWRCSRSPTRARSSGLWLAAGGPDDVHDLSSALTAAGRVAGLLGAYLVLVELLLLARIPLLERIAGFERLAASTASTAASRSRCCSRTPR